MDAEQGEIVEDKHEKDRKKEKKHKSHKEHKSSKDHKSSKEKHKDKDKERSKRSAEVPIAENYANGADGHVHEAGNEAAKAAREEGKDSHREKHKKDGEVRERDSRAEGKEKQKSSHREGRDHADRDERDRQRDTERDRKAERVSEKDKRSSGRRASPIPEPPSKRGGEDGQPAMQDSGGEISMSIEETNKYAAYSPKVSDRLLASAMVEKLCQAVAAHSLPVFTSCASVFVCELPSFKPSPVRPAVHDLLLSEGLVCCLRPAFPPSQPIRHVREGRWISALRRGFLGAGQTASVPGAETPDRRIQGGRFLGCPCQEGGRGREESKDGGLGRAN